MMRRLAVLLVGVPFAAGVYAQEGSRVRAPSLEGAIKPTGTWSVGTRTGDFVFVAGMRGIDPKTNNVVQGDEARIIHAFQNMEMIAEPEGASLKDAVRLVVYVSDMYRFRPLVNKVQEQLWGAGPYPPRTALDVDRFDQDALVELEGTFYALAKR